MNNLIDNWEEDIKHILGQCSCFDMPEGICVNGSGLTSEEKYENSVKFIKSLLEAQRVRTIQECANCIINSFN